jgi:hypothetical protein
VWTRERGFVFVSEEILEQALVAWGSEATTILNPSAEHRC